jgi:pSer/pThr/pTyr-binding forkhead associated (FHA) protein
MVSPQRSEEFMRDCGSRATLALAVEREGTAGARRHVLDAPFALVGRDERNQLCLPDGQVSRRHAYLQTIAGGVFCVDLGSRTGARWNGEARPAGWVAPADCLGIGPFTLRLAADAPELPPVDGPDLLDPLAADTAPPSVPWALELPDGLRWRINRPLTLVGKASRCKLRPNTTEASRFHCALVRAPAGVWVVDLLSSRGTYVNGERVLSALLQEGDELRIGRVVLRLRGEAAAGGSGVSVALGDGDGAACLSPPGPDPLAAAAEGDGAEGKAAPSFPDRALLPRAPAAAVPDLSPAAARPPATPGTSRPEVPETLLGPVINQFSLMQQQMLEQFHQTMVMMAQVFGNLHRDQMTLIREELNQLHQVTEELQSLHVELARRSPAEAAVEVGLPRFAEADLGTVGVRATGGEHAGAVPPSCPTDQAPAAQSGAATRPQPARVRPPAAEGAESIHAILRQRLEALEEERKSRWDKILRFMLGR